MSRLTVALPNRNASVANTALLLAPDASTQAALNALMQRRAKIKAAREQVSARVPLTPAIRSGQ